MSLQETQLENKDDIRARTTSVCHVEHYSFGNRLIMMA